jgi:hypothetical protein
METIKRFPKHTQSISKALPKALAKHYQTTSKKGRIARKEVCLIFEHGNTNKRAGWNKRAGGIFFSKSINVQTKIRPCRGDFFLKINKHAYTSIQYTRVSEKCQN